MINLRRVLFLLIVISIFTIAVIGNVDVYAKETITLRLAHVVPEREDHPYTYVSVKFAELVAAKTNGKYKINIYPGGQLGGDRDLFESIKIGTLDLGVISTPVISGFTPALSALDMPWLFEGDYVLYYRALTGEPGQELLKLLQEETGVKGLAFSFQPWRHMLNYVRPIKEPKDMKGIKFRVMENSLLLDIFKAIGANPVTLPFPEVYTALQTGTVEGFGSDFIGAVNSKFYECLDYCSISGQTTNTPVLVMNGNLFNSLPEEDQKAFEEAAREAADLVFALSLRKDKEYREKLASEGVVIEKLDIEAFKKLTEPIYDKYMKKYPAIKKFVNAVEEIKEE